MDHRRILILDDLDAMRHLLTEILEREGYHVQTAATGWQALDAMARTSFDLILTDLSMPLLGGQELAQALRERVGHTPVIGMLADPTRRAPACELPMTAVIGQPLPLVTLLALVDEVIRG